MIKVVTEGRIGETYNIGGHNEKTNLEVVETICDLLEELAPEKPSGVDNYRDLITFVKDRPVMMLVMLLMLQKLSVNLVGCQKKHLKLVCVRPFSGIWIIAAGGRECCRVLIVLSV